MVGRRLHATPLVLLALQACGGRSSSEGGSTPPPVNAPPTFTSTAAISTPENGDAPFCAAAAGDPEGTSVTYGLAGGANAAQFTITSAGTLIFVLPPDYSDPTDTDNIYLVTVAASDGVSVATLPLRGPVTDTSNSGLRPIRQFSGLDNPLRIIADPYLRGSAI